MPDGITLVEKTVHELATDFLGVIQQLEALGETAKDFGRKSVRLNQNPFELDLRSKQLRIAEQFAAVIVTNSPHIDELALKLRKNCCELEAGFDSYPSLSEIVDPAEHQRVEKSLAILKDSKDNLIGTVEGLEEIRDQIDGFRKFLLDYVGEIEEIDTPLSRSSSSLEKLSKELRSFHTLSTAIINRLT